MTYNYNSKDYIVPDAEVDKLVDALNISMAEACELWLADNGDIENEEQEQANKNAQKNKRRYEQSAKPRKKVEKERKVDKDKAEILRLIQKAFDDHPDIEITGQKTETELYLEYDNVKYTVKLTRHRQKK
jgi:hypothetical protein